MQEVRLMQDFDALKNLPSDPNHCVKFELVLAEYEQILDGRPD